MANHYYVKAIIDEHDDIIGYDVGTACFCDDDIDENIVMIQDAKTKDFRYVGVDDVFDDRESAIQSALQQSKEHVQTLQAVIEKTEKTIGSLVKRQRALGNRTVYAHRVLRDRNNARVITAVTIAKVPLVLAGPPFALTPAGACEQLLVEINTEIAKANNDQRLVAFYQRLQAKAETAPAFFDDGGVQWFLWSDE